MFELCILLMILSFTVSNWRSIRRIERDAKYRADRWQTENEPFRGDLPYGLCLAFGLMFAGGFVEHVIGQEPRTNPPLQTMHLEAPTRSWYRNQTDGGGSCVQMSLGMCGCHSNDVNAACLPFDSPFGKGERGGSLPSRVERYCDARGIRCFNVTGRTIDDTMPWIDWSAKTGRFAAIAFSEAHFQTLYGYDETRREYLVCDNNSPSRIDRYTLDEFRTKHRACMPWCVILEKPSSPPPAFRPWWK